MQVEIWITLLVAMLSIIATIIITWIGTRRTAEKIAEYIGGAVERATKAIHEDVERVTKAMHEDVERITKAIHEDTMKVVSTIHEDIKASQAKLESKLERKGSSSLTNPYACNYIKGVSPKP